MTTIVLPQSICNSCIFKPLYLYVVVVAVVVVVVVFIVRIDEPSSGKSLVSPLLIMQYKRAILFHKLHYKTHTPIFSF